MNTLPRDIISQITLFLINDRPYKSALICLKQLRLISKHLCRAISTSRILLIELLNLQDLMVSDDLQEEDYWRFMICPFRYIRDIPKDYTGDMWQQYYFIKKGEFMVMRNIETGKQIKRARGKIYKSGAILMWIDNRVMLFDETKCAFHYIIIMIDHNIATNFINSVDYILDNIIEIHNTQIGIVINAFDEFRNPRIFILDHMSCSTYHIMNLHDFCIKHAMNTAIRISDSKITYNGIINDRTVTSYEFNDPFTVKARSKKMTINVVNTGVIDVDVFYTANELLCYVEGKLNYSMNIDKTEPRCFCEKYLIIANKVYDLQTRMRVAEFSQHRQIVSMYKTDTCFEVYFAC